MTSDRQSPPIPSDLTGPCGYCSGAISNFTLEDSWWLSSRPVAVGGSTFDQLAMGELITEAAILRCMGCNRNTVVITEGGAGILWFPQSASGVVDDSVPAPIASAYNEGMRCLGIGANRAAAVLFRAALALFIKNRGTDAAKAERHLKVALKQMGAQLHPSLLEWAQHLNQLGNEGAHPEDYDDVTAEEAAELARFLQQLMLFEYEMPAGLVRAKVGASAPQPPTPPAAPAKNAVAPPPWGS